jgi:hypothetical protein
MWGGGGGGGGCSEILWEMESKCDKRGCFVQGVHCILQSCLEKAHKNKWV